MRPGKTLAVWLCEAARNAIYLRMTHLRLRLLDVIQSQITLLIMRIGSTAEYRAAISQVEDHPHALFSKDR